LRGRDWLTELLHAVRGFARRPVTSGEMRILVDTHQQGVRAGIRVHEIRLSAIPVLRDEKRQQKHW